MTRLRPPVLALVAFAVLVLGFAAYQVLGDKPSTSAGPSPAPRNDLHIGGSAMRSPRLQPVPRGSKVLVVGDSWADGTGADSAAHGFLQLTAARRGWHLSMVQGNGRGGYLNPGHPRAGTYLERLRAQPVDPSVRLVIVQGGINDLAQESSGRLPSAVTATVDQARKICPSAQVLVVGVVPPVPIPYKLLVGLDHDIDAGAMAAHAAFVDPITQSWLGDDMHSGGPAKNHPTTQGHAELSSQLLAALRGLGA